MDNQQPFLYTMDEFARVHKMSKPSAYKEISRGNLQTIKIGKRRYVTAGQSAQYIRDKEAGVS
jgi:hypothetical protein